MNQSILHFFNDMAGKSAALDDVAKFFIKGSVIIIPVVILAVYFVGIFRKKELWRTAAVNTGCIVVIALVIGFIIGRLVHETRPMFASGSVTTLLPHANDSSFPSDHMLFCFGAAFGFCPLSKKLGLSLMAFGLLTGIAKVYAGQHYPLDIVLTILVVYVIYLLYQTLISKYVSKLYGKFERWILSLSHSAGK